MCCPRLLGCTWRSSRRPAAASQCPRTPGSHCRQQQWQHTQQGSCKHTAATALRCHPGMHYAVHGMQADQAHVIMNSLQICTRLCSTDGSTNSLVIPTSGLQGLTCLPACQHAKLKARTAHLPVGSYTWYSASSESSSSCMPNDSLNMRNSSKWICRTAQHGAAAAVKQASECCAVHQMRRPGGMKGLDQLVRL